MVGAIVLAGSPNNGSLQTYSAVDYEALIPMGGKLMVEYVVEALSSASTVKKIVVVGPREELLQAPALRGSTLAQSGSNILENIQIGMQSLGFTRKVLAVTSDIPLITASAIDDFISRCDDVTVDLYYPIISRRIIESHYASARRTYVNLKEGVFTGGNIFLFKSDILPGCLDKGKQLIEARKNPLRLASMLGLSFLIKFMTCNLSLREAEEKFSGLLGIKGKAVISGYPEMGMDVDKLEDLELVVKLLNSSAS
jgi:GTP:adenosylcobinamide-phosphate guanylyltransferase